MPFPLVFNLSREFDLFFQDGRFHSSLLIILICFFLLSLWCFIMFYGKREKLLSKSTVLSILMTSLILTIVSILFYIIAIPKYTTYDGYEFVNGLPIQYVSFLRHKTIGIPTQCNYIIEESVNTPSREILDYCEKNNLLFQPNFDLNVFSFVSNILFYFTLQITIAVLYNLIQRKVTFRKIVIK